ncbi:MAG: glycoside hydrolase family 2 TIM barrel-domain containing protein [Candidatus Omnitrophota bacterium]
MQTQKSGIERRRYIRLSTVFPVEFEVISLDDKEVLCEFHQAFTRDVSEGGMCLEINNLKDDLAEKLNRKSAKLRLQINMPFSSKPIEAIAEAAWIKKTKEHHPNKYLLGVYYEKISEKERRGIVGHARFLTLRPLFVGAAILLLVVAVAVTRVELIKKEALRKETEKKLALIESERTKLAQAMEDLKVSKGGLESKIIAFEREKADLEDKLAAAKSEAMSKPEEIARLESELAKANQKTDALNLELSKVADSRKELEAQLKVLEEIKASKPVKVTLAAGGIIVGKVILETADSVRVEIPTGVITLRRELITSMATPSEEEIAELARERIRLELRAKEVEKQRDIERRKAEERGKAEKIIAKKIPGEPDQLVPRKIADRGVMIRENRIYADGSLFYIKGVAYGISAPGLPPGADGCFSKIPLSVFENDFRMMKGAGINTIRTYEPFPDALLDLAEKYDLKIIEQVVYPSAYTDYSSEVELKALKRMATEAVKKHKNRKCILMWSIWNDAPFCYDEPGNPVPRYGFDTVNKFMKEIYLAVKAVDKGHPVTAANILKVKGYDLGFDFLDVIGCNAYIGGHGFNWRGHDEAVKSVKEMKAISRKYKKPVIITETGYSTFVKKDTQDKALNTQIKSAEDDLAGIVIFEWTDEWWKGGNPSVQDKHIEEYWGILTWDRKPKAGFETVSKLFNSIPTDSLGYSPLAAN